VRCADSTFITVRIVVAARHSKASAGDYEAECSMSGISIGKLAQAARVSIDTIRFYEKCGLLPAPARRPSGFREYSLRDLAQLKFVRRARQLGFSIPEITELLSVDQESDRARTQQILEHKLVLIDRKIGELAQWRQHLQRRMDEQPRVDAPMRTLLEFFADTTTSSDVIAPEGISRPLSDAHEER
jgi:MerR family copper efflux transcriptional regulator